MADLGWHLGKIAQVSNMLMSIVAPQ